MKGHRFCWGPQFTRPFNFEWGIIRHDSFVVITASEGRERVEDRVILYTSQSPQRHLGAARFTVDNIAPYDGGVRFHVTIDWPSPLILWTDIIVFDELFFTIDGFRRI
jgi:hypothetical protein